MILGIDASNIRAGGGVTHLVGLLRAADPPALGVSKVVIWSGKSTLERIEDRPWLIKSRQPLLEMNLSLRIFWQRFRLSGLARAAGCDLLFVPGGSYVGNFHPVVAMSQNLLPFEWHELRRFGWSWKTFKFLLLRLIQTRTFRRAEGLIFLTAYARDTVMEVVKTAVGKKTIIPHGIDSSFICPPREQLPITRYTFERPFRILYVSGIDVYKHQWHVAESVAQLRRGGLPVALDLVGPAYPPALKRLKKILSRIDPQGEFVHYSGAVPYTELYTRYAKANLYLFASSCENMPNILLEGMASGLPIACSNSGSMSEILGSAGVYFNPEDPQDITRALKELVSSPELRTEKARLSFEAVQAYSWDRCSKETFEFIADVFGTKDGKCI